MKNIGIFLTAIFITQNLGEGWLVLLFIGSVIGLAKMKGFRL
jgi:NOL1/NOP2/fmu family ribosome biogenesis protein